MPRLPTVLSLLRLVLGTTLALCQSPNNPYPSGLYSNDFVDPDWVVSRKFPQSTLGAQQTIVEWADQLNMQGPWSVMNKSATPPSGNKHDYLSWAPYWWPDCSSVGNKTELTPEQIWVQCPYVNRDGQFNPDRILVTDLSGFNNMSDAVMYNAMAWIITNSSKYSVEAAKYLNVWFLNNDTMMNPNLNYAQVTRGPNGAAQHTGLLDLKEMARIATGVMILRKGNSPDWTKGMDTQMTNWTKTYITWMQSNPLGKAELASENNHGTFCFNQLTALQTMIGDSNGAKASLNTFFKGAYMNQIAANGDQPLESARTHPYHYRAYNLEAIIVNAKIASYLGVNYWNTTTSSGGGIKAALDYAMGFKVDHDGDGPTEELFPDVAAVASIYGDPNNKYSDFLKNGDPNYPRAPYFLFNQPLSDSGLPAAKPDGTGPAVTPTPTGGKSGSSNGSGVTRGFGTDVACLGLVALTSAFMLLWT